jgi:hypothetical protein
LEFISPPITTLWLMSVVNTQQTCLDLFDWYPPIYPRYFALNYTTQVKDHMSIN